MKLLIHISLGASILLIHLFSIIPPYQARAHDNGNTSAADQPKAHANEAYEFIVEPGCSLSLITRRALQLYDQNRPEVTLSPASTIYAETNAVQKFGSRELEIGEGVTIDTALLHEYTEKSKTLSSDTLAAWQGYADQADFDLEYIKPTATSAARTEPKPEVNHESTQSNDGNQPPSSSDNVRNFKTDRPRLRSFWWAIGLVSLAALYYLLGQQKTVKRR